MLQGYKTYIIAAIAVLSAILAYKTGQADLFETINAVLLALGLGTLRAGVKADTAA